MLPRFPYTTAPAITIGIVLMMSSIAVTVPSGAQSHAGRGTRVAQRFAALATEANMTRATAINMDGRGVIPLIIDDLSVGVAQVDVKAEVGVRVHLFYYNPTDHAVTMLVPEEESFVLVDGKGRRLMFLSMRIKNLAKGATDITVPSLERAEVVLLYSLQHVDEADASLKIGTVGAIRGVPLRAPGDVAPVVAAPTPTPGAAPVPTPVPTPMPMPMPAPVAAPGKPVTPPIKPPV